MRLPNAAALRSKPNLQARSSSSLHPSFAVFFRLPEAGEGRYTSGPVVLCFEEEEEEVEAEEEDLEERFEGAAGGAVTTPS